MYFTQMEVFTSGAGGGGTTLYSRVLPEKYAFAYLAGESHGLGEGVDPLAVLGEFLLIFQSCHLQLAVYGGKLRQE